MHFCIILEELRWRAEAGKLYICSDPPALFLAGFASPALEFGFDVKIDLSEGMRQECGMLSGL
jgi:hypothetical protein